MKIDDLILILTTNFKPLSCDEGCSKRTISINDQKLFLFSALVFEQIFDDKPFATKKEFNHVTQLSERFVSRVSTALENAGLVCVEKQGFKFRFTVLISAIARLSEESSNE